MKKDREKNKNTTTLQTQPSWVQLAKKVHFMLVLIESIFLPLID